MERSGVVARRIDLHRRGLQERREDDLRQRGGQQMRFWHYAMTCTSSTRASWSARRAVAGALVVRRVAQSDIAGLVDGDAIFRIGQVFRGQPEIHGMARELAEQTQWHQRGDCRKSGIDEAKNRKLHRRPHRAVVQRHYVRPVRQCQTQQDGQGLLANEQTACAMEHQAALLLARLGRREPHVWPGDRLADGLSVGGIVLLSLDVRLDVGRRHQAHRMTTSLQFARPMMR